MPDTTVNPLEYRADWRGELHCVRYNRAFFEGLLHAQGLAIQRLDYEQETDGQSGLYITRRGP